MIKPRTSSVVLLALACTVAVGGCSRDSDAASGAASPSSSSPTSTSAPTTSGGTVAGHTLTGQLTRALAAAGSFTMVNDTPAAGWHSTSQVKMKGQAMDVATTFRLSSVTGDIVAVKNGKRVYARSKAMGLSRWTKLDPTSSDPALKKVSTTLLAATTPASPWNSFGLLNRLTFTRAGQEKVGGVDATKYTAQVPAQMVLAATPAAQRPLLKAVLGDRPTPLVQDVDPKGRPIRQTLTVTVGDAPQPVTTSWSGFGTPVTVKEPV